MHELNSAQKSSSLREVFYIIFRHKKKILIFFGGVMFVAIALALIMPDIYQSEARFLLRLGRENVVPDPTTGHRATIPISSTREQEMNSQLEILRSREIAEKVVDKLGPEMVLGERKRSKARTDDSSSIEDLKRRAGEIWGTSTIIQPDKDRSEAIDHVMENLIIEPQRRSSTITIMYQAKSPVLAYTVMNELMNAYKEKHIEVHYSRDSFQFFTDQSGQLRRELEATEEELKEIRNRTGISSLPEQKTQIITRIGEIQREIDSNYSNLWATRARVESLRNQINKLPRMSDSFSSTGNDLMRAELFSLQVELEDLLSRYSESSPIIIEKRRQIEKVKELLESQTQVIQGADPTYQALEVSLLEAESYLESLNSNAEKLRNLMTSAQSELRTLNNNEARILELERKRAFQEENFRRYLENLEQSRIDHALQSDKITNISILQAATFPVEPIGPNRLLNVLLGLFLGTFGGLGMAFVFEALDHSIKKPEDIQKKLSIKSLISVPWLRGMNLTSPERFNKYYNGFVDKVFTTADPADVTHMIAFTSSNRHEGVSTVASQFASTLASRNNGRTLIVDLNFEHPSLHKRFGVNISPGVGDILASEQVDGKVFQASPIENLYVLSAGKYSEEGGQNYDMASLKNLMNISKQKFTYIVFDTPALGESNLVTKWAEIFDSLILVIESEGVRWEIVHNYKEMLDEENIKIPGAILNKRHYYIPKWIYKRI